MKFKYILTCFSFLLFFHQPVQAQGPCDRPHLISDFNAQTSTLHVQNVGVGGTPISANFFVRPDLGLELMDFAPDTGPLDPDINSFNQDNGDLKLGCTNVGAFRLYTQFQFSDDGPGVLFDFVDAGHVTDPSETDVWTAQLGRSCNNLTGSEDMIFNKDHSAQFGSFDGTWSMNQGALNVHLFGGSDFNGEIGPDGIRGDLDKDFCLVATPKESLDPIFFHNGRFKVDLLAPEFSDSSGQGPHTKLTDESVVWAGLKAKDAKIYARVSDDCSSTNNFAVFAAGTTDVEYTLTVTDTQSGESKEYFNPLGTAGAAITDTAAFATCP